MEIHEIFKGIDDPRIERTKLHMLEDIFGLTLIAVVCGSESWELIEEFGKRRHDLLSQLLELPNGIPSHDTIERLFKRVDSKEFEQVFINWTSSLCLTTKGKLISFDGKNIRGSQDEINGKYAIHMVSAWCNDNQMSLGQIKTKAKINEIEAIGELLDLINVEGSILTIDAMGCQKAIAEKIIDKNADYILAVKDNQKSLYDEVIQSFKIQSLHDVDEYITKDHGRIETRKCSVITDLKWIDEAPKWKGLKSIIKIDSQRETGNKIQNHTRYYISSSLLSAKEFNGHIQSHWGIENSCHWVLDVQFREDESRKRKDEGAANFAIIRRMALNLLKQRKYKRFGTNNKRLIAAMDDDFLFSVLNLKN